MKAPSIHPSAAGLMLAGSLLAGAHANPVLWSPAGGGSWNVADHWNPAGVPGAGDDIAIAITEAGTITLDADQTGSTLLLDNTAALTITGGGANRTLILGGGATATHSGAVNIGSSTAGQNVSITADTLTKTGSGELQFWNASTIGNVSLERGNTLVRQPTSLGAGDSGVITLGAPSGSNPAILRIGSGNNFAKPIVLQSGGTGILRIDTIGASSGAIFSGGITGDNNIQLTNTNNGTITFSTNPINPSGNVTLANIGTTGAAGSVTVSTVIGENVGSVTVSRDSGTNPGSFVSLSNTSAGNAWTGDTTVNTGATLRLATGNVIPDGPDKGDVIVDGTLDLRAGSETINGLSGTGTVTRGQAGGSTLIVGANDTTSTFSGLIQNGTGTVTLAKTGAGTLTLDTGNTHSGGTQVRAGLLLITHGNALGSGAGSVGSAAAASLLTGGPVTIPNSIQVNADPGEGVNVIGGSTDNTSTFSGPIQLAGDATISQAATTGANALHLTGGIVSNSAQDQTLTFAGPGRIRVDTHPIADGPDGALAVRIADGEIIFAAPNAYTGTTTLEGGSLTLTQPAFHDASTVEISSGATLVLDFAGTDTIGRLTLDGIVQDGGTWGAPGSGADHVSDRISGGGILLVSQADFLWTGGAGNGNWSNGGNWDVNSPPGPDTRLRFGNSAVTSLSNNLPAGTPFTHIRFEPDAPSFTIGGNPIVLTNRLENASGAFQVLNLSIELGGDVVIDSSTNLIELGGDISGGFGIVKTGTDEAILSGANTYTGTTTIAGGGLTIGGQDSLPAGTTLAFTNTNVPVFLDIAGIDQSLAGITFGTQTSAGASITLYGSFDSSLTTSPANLTFAPAAAPAAAGLSVSMGSLGGFTYDNPAGTFSLQAGAATGTGITTVVLAGETNSITAANLNLAAVNAASGNRSVLHLGLNNKIHANNLNLAAGSGRASAVLEFSPGLAPGGTLEIRNTAGSGAANVVIGRNSSFGTDTTTYASVLDTTGNEAVLDALVGTLLIGNAQCDGTGASRRVHSNGTFRMGAGSLTASSADIGVIGGITPTGPNTFTATGLLDLTGPGTAGIATITLAQNNLPLLNGTTHLDGQISIGGGARLNAATIRQGAVVFNETSRTARINWDDGTIGNLPGEDLSISGVEIVLGGTGTHTFDIAAGRTATVSSAIGSAAPGAALTKTGEGTLILSGANTYAGDTVIAAGILETTTGYLDDASKVEISTGGKLHLNFSGTDAVASLTFDDVPQEIGTYGATGSGAAFIDDTRFSGAGVLRVTGASGDPFEDWIDSFTFAPGADTSRGGDPDGDGLTNEQEFAFDGDPTSGAASGKIASALHEGHLTLTLPVRAGASFTGDGPLISDPIDGLVYRIDGSGDLSTFTAGVGEIPALSAGLPALSSEDWTYRSFRLTAPINSTSKGFLRAGLSSEEP